MWAMPPSEVAAVEVAAEEAVLVARRLGLAETPDQVAIELPHPPHVGGWAKGVDADPDGNAGHAGFAGRPVGDALAAAKAALRQKIVQFGGARPHQVREDFSLQPPGQIRAGARRGQIELVGVGYDLRHRSSLTRGHHTTPDRTARQDCRSLTALGGDGGGRLVSRAHRQRAEDEIVQELLPLGE